MECSGSEQVQSQSQSKPKPKRKPKTPSNSIPQTTTTEEVVFLKCLEPEPSLSFQLVEETTEIYGELDNISASTFNSDTTSVVESAEITIKPHMDALDLDPPNPAQSKSRELLAIAIQLNVVDVTILHSEVPEIEPGPETPELQLFSASIISKTVSSDAISDSIKIHEDLEAVTTFFQTNFPNLEPLPSTYPLEPPVYLIPEELLDYTKLKYNYNMLKHIIIVEPAKTEPEPKLVPTPTRVNYMNLRELIEEADFAATATAAAAPGRKRREKDQVNANLEGFNSEETLEAGNLQKFLDDTDFPESCSETSDSKDQLSASVSVSTDSSSRLAIDEALASKFDLLRELSDVDADEMNLVNTLMGDREARNAFEPKPSTTLENVLAEIKYWTTTKCRNAWRRLKSIKARIGSSWKSQKRSRQVAPMVSLFTIEQQPVRSRLGAQSSSSEELEYLVAQKVNKAKAQAAMRKKEPKPGPRNGTYVESGEDEKFFKPSPTLIGRTVLPSLIYPDHIRGSSYASTGVSMSKTDRKQYGVNSWPSTSSSTESLTLKDLGQPSMDYKKLQLHAEVTADPRRRAEKLGEMVRRAPISTSTIPTKPTAGFRMPEYGAPTFPRPPTPIPQYPPNYRGKRTRNPKPRQRMPKMVRRRN